MFMTGHVAADGQNGEEALRAPLLGHQRDPCLDHLVRWRLGSFFPLKMISPSIRVGAVDGPRQLGLAGADQAVEADDLPAWTSKEISFSLWLERLRPRGSMSSQSRSLGVYCSKTVLPIIILISSDRSLTSDSGLVSMWLPSRMTVT